MLTLESARCGLPEPGFGTGLDPLKGIGYNCWVATSRPRAEMAVAVRKALVGAGGRPDRVGVNRPRWLGARAAGARSLHGEIIPQGNLPEANYGLELVVGNWKSGDYCFCCVCAFMLQFTGGSEATPWTRLR